MTGEGTISQVLAGEARWAVVCGDCLEVLPTLADKSVDAVVTDPPYGFGVADWDGEIPSLSWLDDARRIASFVVFTPGNGSQFSYPPPAWTLCWARPGSVQRACGGGFSHWEPVLVYGEKNPYRVDYKAFPANTGAGDLGHRCPKPEPLMEWLVSGCSVVGHTILDPFAGSGTTGVAALRLGRRVILIEREPRWADLCRERLRVEESGSTLAARRAGQVPMFGGER